MYKRFDYKKVFKGSGNDLPEGAIACCEPDPVTGHWPHWVKVTASDKWHLQAEKPLEDGTYELCGPKINGNKDKFEKHVYVNHDSEDILVPITSLKYDYLKDFLTNNYMEGLVIKYKGDAVKVRKSDFGLKW